MVDCINELKDLSFVLSDLYYDSIEGKFRESRILEPGSNKGTDPKWLVEAIKEAYAIIPAEPERV